MLATLFAASVVCAQASGFIDEPSSQPSTPPLAPAPGPSESSDDTDTEPVATVSTWQQGLTLGGFVDGEFYASWPGEQNSFVVGEVEADVEKRLGDVARVRIDVNVYNQRPWQLPPAPGATYFTNAATFFDYLVEQAFGEWFPLGESGPRLRLGKYNALVGFERQDGPDRLTVTESLVFVHGSPANLTGAALEVPLPAGLHLTIHGAFNGWDQGQATTTDKSVGGQLHYQHRFSHRTELQLSGTALWGAEPPFGHNDKRLSLYAMAAWNYDQRFLLAGESTYGNQQGIGRAPDGSVPGTLNASWFGVSAWVRYQWLSWFSTTFRYDYFNDPDRVRDLIQTVADTATGGLSRRQELTGNLSFQIVNGVVLRLEYNADFIESNVSSLVRAQSIAQRFFVQGLYGW